jgi:hypothetical protein
MLNWLQQSFQENTVLWLFISSTLGGIIGASTRLVFDVILPRQLQQKGDVIAVKRKYATPILRAAEELRRRLENMINHIDAIEKQGWLSHEPPGYYYYSTLYVVGQFFGWLQILRRTVVYLDFTTTKETQKFERFLQAIEKGFTDPDLLQGTGVSYGPPADGDRWIYSFGLQAVGDRMIISDADKHRTIDYASFHRQFTQQSNDEFRQWFEPLEKMFHGLKANDVRFRRMVATHAILNSFV